MTLTTHAVVGGFLGALAFQNPVLAGVVGFSSHFLLDSIPHWDYRLASAHEDALNRLNNDIVVSNKAFVIDIIKIGFDFCLGLAIVWLIFHTSSHSVFLGASIGALCAILPDPLQFVYMKFRHEPFTSLQRFHMFVHAKSHLKDRPFPGIGSQILLIAIVIVLSHFII